MSIDRICADLEASWDDEGFLGNLRDGNFNAAASVDFLALLESIRLEDEDTIPRRFLSLVWYIPIFLSWQEKRVDEAGFDVVSYKKFVAQVINSLEEVLGVP